MEKEIEIEPQNNKKSKSFELKRICKEIPLYKKRKKKKNNL